MTILHSEANRKKDSIFPLRYARHYYDLYKMACSSIKEAAFKQIELLSKVVNFNIKFYPRPWARYQEISKGHLKLRPNNHHINELKSDYEAMKEMIYGEYPSFDRVIEELKTLEKEIKALIAPKN